MRVSTDAKLGLGLAVGLGVLIFATGSGFDLARNTWAEIALVGVAAALAIVLFLHAAPGRAWGAATLALFAALAALTAISISWSVQPADSWVEANRTFAYLAAFGGAIALARLFPARWPALLGAIALATVFVSAYPLLLKVFPAAFDPNETFGRLRAPFDYWNATGLIAALGLPAVLWGGARRGQARALRAMAFPATGILVATLVLSYSRGALVVAVVGLVCWFVLVPLRLRAAAVLAIGAAGGTAVSVWALSTHPITHDGASLASRTTAGHAFGLVLVLVLVLLTLAGFAASFAMDRATPSDELRRRAGIALIALAALVPLGGIGALAASSRGLTGEVSHIWTTLTSPSGGVGDNSGRLVQVANSRGRYWSEAVKVGEHHLLHGAGALGYGTARTRYTTTDPYLARHAHGYVVETFADFGLIGLAVNLALLMAWGVASGRTVGWRSWYRQPREHAAEHTGMLTLLVIVLIFGLHSAIDWTWFVPGTAVPALLCAGWLAGRGPLATTLGRKPSRRRLTASPGLSAAAVAVVGVAVIAAWAIWQPLRSLDADTSALAALSRGNANAAIAGERAAIARDSLAVEPYWHLSAIYTATGSPTAAHRELVKAISVQPQNSGTWLMLGEFDLQLHHRTEAIKDLERAVALDSRPRSDARLALAQAQT